MSATKSPAQRARGKTRRDWKPLFLKALDEEGTVSAACLNAGIDRSTAYRARQQDEDFAIAWADTEAIVTDKLERKAVSLALGGDTRMLEFLLKARRPEAYRDNVRVEHSGTIKQDVVVDVVPDDERRFEVARLLDGQGALNGHGSGH